jgi:3-keto steroid reductase
MACRSRQRAEAARTQLLALFESDVARLRRSPSIAERVEAFRANLIVEIHTLDLASVQSTLAFAEDVARTWVLSLSPFFFCFCSRTARADALYDYRYPYVSHLVCNAGVAPFLNISWPLLLRQVWRDLLELNLFRLVTIPEYNIQRRAMMSDDELGWVWQCNVFGHYILVCLSSISFS